MRKIAVIVANIVVSLILFFGGLSFIAVFIFTFATGSFSDMGNGNAQLSFLYLLMMGLISVAGILGLFIRFFICANSTLKSYIKYLSWELAIGSGSMTFFLRPIDIAKMIYLEKGEASEKDVIYYTAKFTFWTAYCSMRGSLFLLVPIAMVYFIPGPY
ncbi:hypothetical protein [Photobacterium chitinilyticum]|uniref:Uncharacterized protein n=1 Tax=Photobacterium chitinilyticum TaxID=2485123 RepID=A0A3S3QLH1_9GAMM|nr:hypothetical protein [Photobacterium chitinilyticum]RWX52768.1 hypothetical protein EDI28_25480 [Photobacterium chitinilyticum]